MRPKKSSSVQKLKFIKHASTSFSNQTNLLLRNKALERKYVFGPFWNVFDILPFGKDICILMKAHQKWAKISLIASVAEIIIP